ncbi:hypothetical protein J4573_06535 [Actinomadura barringtoniae]|uniref:Uncharacterized protein n=1 Tax=Actinomadura barringtoniae TaxID=1427535 RepID=A0A939T8B6_9ACTN|nr:hypothetical protein [Actinomadura barringtoniae]MBO2446740.1 hypothetical protein [Actinomadura barringtoniae]
MRDKRNTHGSRAVRAGGEAADGARKVSVVVNGWGGHLTLEQHAELLGQLVTVIGHLGDGIRAQAGYLGQYPHVVDGLREAAGGLDSARESLKKVQGQIEELA